MSKFLFNTLQMQGDNLERVYEYIRSNHSQLDFNRILPIPIDCRDKPAWARSHWGTKFGGAFQVERIAKNIYSFRTYGKAVPVIAELARRFPDVRFHHQWSEQLPGWNSGVVIYESGKEIRRSESEWVDELPLSADDYLENLTEEPVAAVL